MYKYQIRLKIADYFNSLINEIDIKAETTLMDPKTSDAERKDINNLRQKIELKNLSSLEVITSKGKESQIFLEGLNDEKQNKLAFSNSFVLLFTKRTTRLCSTWTRLAGHLVI